MRLNQFCPAALLFCLVTVPGERLHAEPNRPFTVEDDISLSHFGEVVVSPKRDLVVVRTERGCLDDDSIHETLRVYDMNSLRDAIRLQSSANDVRPVWTIEEALHGSTGNTDPVSRLRWLSDGSGFGFLLQEDKNHHRLFEAELSSRNLIPLTAIDEDVLGFDIRDRTHFVFTVASRTARTQLVGMLTAPFQVGSGHFLEELSYPEDAIHHIQRGDLWAAVGGAPEPVRNRENGQLIEMFSDGTDALALSPNGRELVALQAVEDVSQDWVRNYPPPFPESAYRLKPHHQNLAAAADGWSYVSQWVRIDLLDGDITSLTDAPASHRAGWWEVYTPFARWSDDGTNILLPGTFSQSQTGPSARPCVQLVHSESLKSECVRALKRQLPLGYEKGWESIDDLQFAPGRNDQIWMTHIDHDGHGDVTTVYGRQKPGTWAEIDHRAKAAGFVGPELIVREDFRHPPLLVATDRTSGRERVILDPNPQLKRTSLGEVVPYHWRDRSGREWQGLLYKPAGYKPHTRYPIVIQNHGFSMDRFVPSGGFPSAFVAQELATAGIMVLHVRDCPVGSTPKEGPCNVAGYESAVRQLSQEGLIDPQRVGIIGFSRTVYYVLDALTEGRPFFKAASITDGIAFSYTNYLESVGPDRTFLNEAEQVIGSQPFGKGLTRWLQASPVFHLDRMDAALRVVSGARSHVLDMWEPYALLEEMHKPVDLIVLNTEEHVITEPRIRLAAQTGNVDWFRFWLQGVEDPDPAKRGEYERWERLRYEMRTTHSQSRQPTVLRSSSAKHRAP